MQSFIPGQANIITVDLINRSTGEPITAGTVIFYLKSLAGSQTGKWFRGSDNTWQAAEAGVGAASHESRGHWTCEIPASAWIANTRYEVYAVENTDIQIYFREDVVELHPTVNITIESAVVRG